MKTLYKSKAHVISFLSLSSSIYASMLCFANAAILMPSYRLTDELQTDG